jgi:hypothetical protein
VPRRGFPLQLVDVVHLRRRGLRGGGGGGAGRGRAERERRRVREGTKGERETKENKGRE